MYQEENCQFAVKILKNVKNDKDLFLAEKKIMKMINHEFIIKYFDSTTLDAKLGPNTIWIAMEFADAGTLETFIRDNKDKPSHTGFKEESIWKMIKDLSDTRSIGDQLIFGLLDASHIIT